MTNENTVTLFPCKDAVSDGCPNTTVAPDTYCCDCHLFYEEIAESQKLLNDESWKSPADSIAAVDAARSVLPHFEIVDIPEPLPEPVKPDLDGVCYTMNAAEVDCQAALFEIAAVLAKYQDTLKQIDTVLASYEVH